MAVNHMRTATETHHQIKKPRKQQQRYQTIHRISSSPGERPGIIGKRP
jgi:hypothetical protein